MRSIPNLIGDLLTALLFGDVYVVVDPRYILEYLLASSFMRDSCIPVIFLSGDFAWTKSRGFSLLGFSR